MTDKHVSDRNEEDIKAMILLVIYEGDDDYPERVVVKAPDDMPALDVADYLSYAASITLDDIVMAVDNLDSDTKKKTDQEE